MERSMNTNLDHSIRRGIITTLGEAFCGDRGCLHPELMQTEQRSWRPGVDRTARKTTHLEERRAWSPTLSGEEVLTGHFTSAVRAEVAGNTSFRFSKCRILVMLPLKQPSYQPPIQLSFHRSNFHICPDSITLLFFGHSSRQISGHRKCVRTELSRLRTSPIFKDGKIPHASVVSGIPIRTRVEQRAPGFAGSIERYN